ncbi:hypothetical protein F4802DRAFT_573410 [Xylaria palmicola]|nr:hypothetical protein F4802DRAFT_573410 [Xylaria palmicola]
MSFFFFFFLIIFTSFFVMSLCLLLSAGLVIAYQGHNEWVVLCMKVPAQAIKSEQRPSLSRPALPPLHTHPAATRPEWDPLSTHRRRPMQAEVSPRLSPYIRPSSYVRQYLAPLQTAHNIHNIHDTVLSPVPHIDYI